MEFAKVIIVGGGAAGLGAAKTLGPKINYILIEAQDYIGGRIRSTDAAPNIVIDLGAQYIHGEKNNIVYEICKQLDCIMPETDESDETNETDDTDDTNDTDDANDDILAITSDRTEIDTKIMSKAIDVWDEILRDAQAKFGDVTIPTHYSLSDYLLQHLKKRLLDSLSVSENVIDELVDYFNKAEVIESGCLALSDLSLAGYGSFEDLDGSDDNEFENGGYRPFLSYMKSFIPDDNRIRLNTEVIRVKYLKETHQLLVDIRYHDKTSEQQISTILCDHIIWTSSLGYLKENFSSIFADEIELIEQKREAINNLGFGTVNKVVMIYEKRFWPENVKAINLLHTGKQLSFEFSESLKDLLNVEKVDADVVNTIIEAIHRYDVLRSTDIPVLICWFGGPAAILLEDLSEKAIGQICHEVLCNYLNISSQSNEPNRILKSEWHKNKFVRGSYSYYSIKSRAKDGEQLRAAYEPDGIPRIQFAGEATHEKFYSTVHGALESGIREGTKLSLILNQ